MTDEPRAMREIHEIRLQIHEETKNMTSEEEIAFYNNALREAEERRGIKFRRPSDAMARKVM